MELIPAIDLHNGACVRLVQGDFDRATVFSNDPAAMARHWEQQGASRLHVVDLDGAKTGRPVNTEAITAIVQAVEIPVQLGGGLRNADTVRDAFALGVERVILGTAAVQQPDLLGELVARYRPRIIVGVDARNGKVATSAWLETSDIDATTLVRDMTDMGVERFIYTDITRDGTMTEPNFGATAALVETDGAAIIASGGISALSHIRRLATLGVEGVVIGRALYAGTLSLPDALAVLREGNAQ